jgi:hypothetical protein
MFGAVFEVAELSGLSRVTNLVLTSFQVLDTMLDHIVQISGSQTLLAIRITAFARRSLILSHTQSWSKAGHSPPI